MIVRIEQGFKARQLVQNEIAVKEEIKNLKMGSTVCSHASTRVGLGSGTIVRPPPLSSRWTETWIPRKWNSKGGFADYTKRNIQGITDIEITSLMPH